VGDRTRLIFAIVLSLIALSIAYGAEVSRQISAGDVRAVIEAGQPAEFDNYTIVGDLNLSKLEIAELVHFNHTLFQNSVNFNSTTFNGTAYFRYSDFNSIAYFRHSDFKGDADFIDSNFNSTADFRGSAFNGYADFGGSEFNRTAYFWESAFNSTADFRYSAFNGDTYFMGSAFNGTADFWESAFKGDAYFGESAFKGDAHFEGSGFNSTADFRGSAFNGYADFGLSRFKVSDFRATKFNKEAQFNDAQFSGTANFNNSQFTGDALFENTIFQSKLSLTKARYDKLFIRWYNIKGGLVYDDAAYMSLMKNFKDLGYFEDYDSCYFQYRREHRGQPWPAVNVWEAGIRKVIDYPLEWFYGYGTKPLNAFLFSMGIIISFAGFWRALGLGGPKDRTKEGLKPDEEWLEGDITDILGFSVTVFLSGTKFFIDPPAIPKIEGRSRSLIKKAFVLERLLGALFSILFFIAVSGTIVRST